MKGIISPGLFPVIVFLSGAFISLSTGSSYGTFAILMAIAIPVAVDLNAPLYVTIAAVFQTPYIIFIGIAIQVTLFFFIMKNFGVRSQQQT